MYMQMDQDIDEKINKSLSESQLYSHSLLLAIKLLVKAIVRRQQNEQYDNETIIRMEHQILLMTDKHIEYQKHTFQKISFYLYKNVKISQLNKETFMKYIENIETSIQLIKFILSEYTLHNELNELQLREKLINLIRLQNEIKSISKGIYIENIDKSNQNNNLILKGEAISKPWISKEVKRKSKLKRNGKKHR